MFINPRDATDPYPEDVRVGLKRFFKALTKVWQERAALANRRHNNRELAGLVMHRGRYGIMLVIYCIGFPAT